MKLKSKKFPKKLSKEAQEKILAGRWVKKREHLHELSNNIHRLRLNVSRDLNSPKEKVRLTALAISVMLKTGERVGNLDSANNNHHGITVLNKRHVKVDGNVVKLNYVGKSGVKHEKSFTDDKIAEGLKNAIYNSPNKYVFSISDGSYRVTENRINNYLSDFNITAKDLRGFCANKWIISKLKAKDIPETEKLRKQEFNKTVKSVATKIGHSAFTLKKHYMIPELPIEYIQHSRIIDMKAIGYYKEGGSIGIDKKNQK